MIKEEYNKCNPNNKTKNDINLNESNMSNNIKNSQIPELSSRKSPDGTFDWMYVNTKVSDLRLLLSLIDGEPCITFKIDTTCPAVLEKNAKGVLTFLSEDEVSSLLNKSDNPSIDTGRLFVTSAGCTNERSRVRISNLNFDLDRSDLVTIKLSDIPRLSKSLNKQGILFDSNALAHLSFIDERLFDTLNIKSLNIGLQTSVTYSLTNIENKIIAEVENANKDFINIEEVKATKFLVLKKATITKQHGEVVTLFYGHRPKPNVASDEESFTIPKVAVTLTFLKDKEDNLYMVVNKENRPPIEGENLVASPAGLCDIEDGDITASALRELSEETGTEVGDIYKNLKSHSLGFFASTSKSVSETFGGVVLWGEIDKLEGQGLKNGNISYVPKNSDNGVTESVILIKIDKDDFVENIISKLSEYGTLDAHTVALLNVFYVEFKENSRNSGISLYSCIKESLNKKI